MSFVIDPDTGRANQNLEPVITPRGTNAEVIEVWAGDWLSTTDIVERATIARTLCHRLGIDPEAGAE